MNQPDPIQLSDRFVLSESETKMHDKYGNFYCELATGKRPAVTEAQKHFILVAKRKANPITDHEFLYW